MHAALDSPAERRQFEARSAAGCMADGRQVRRVVRSTACTGMAAAPSRPRSSARRSARSRDIDVLTARTMAAAGLRPTKSIKRKVHVRKALAAAAAAKKAEEAKE